MAFKISRSQRLTAVIGIASIFFIAEISVGFYTHSIALVADAFHYLNDLVGFIVALVALKVSETNEPPRSLSFGWQRAQLLGAFFNGVLLFALGISVFLQSIERFVTLQRVEDPKLMLVMGSVGLGLNLVSAIFLHVSHGHDLGMMGVLLHVIGDAINNIGVMVAALVIWLTHYEGRYYADPGTSMGIAIMIILSSLPLVRRSGFILLESVPNEINPADVKHDLEKIPGVLSIHELHIWRLNQQKTLASVHVVVSDPSVSHFLKLAKIINECFHAYGIHSATLQPEIPGPGEVIMLGQDAEKMETVEIETKLPGKCQVVCGELCEALTCCG
ncbi:cation diffusion facilitator family metal ion transporter [Aspergillus steynii IBT 23096]|uniref:Cation diffusion facilitator family metal ion transporter n=1 Tax=Aspergillus steynii IBT 23096 TaxID=1392250 RepID=A0A2I2GCI0_9EURO|nr:cation diffusion facilitator family metal ion transporter [Aspergillus steynii IBT 23096]PLB50582.1 cation diffusion facilitator family metal ion transporter [Aspergillus steynii IBT 23096]